jgi:hypothetical protein
VKLAPEAFVSPFNYSLVNNSIGPQITQLIQYLEGTAPNAGPLTLLPGVRESVASSYKLESIWFAADPSYWAYTIERYYGSSKGMFRVFPGHFFAKNYDNTRRTWYLTAIGADQKNNIAVTPPYLDTSGAILLTVCHTIFVGSATAHTASDPIDGVLCMDMTLSSFYTITVSNFPPCASARCFVIDNAGFIVVHPSYSNGSVPSAAEHIMSKEPAVAWELVKNSVMFNASCVEIFQIVVQSFWKVNVTTQTTLPSGNVIYPVAGTNIYVIVQNSVAPPPANASCSCNNPSYSGLCSTTAACQCPCYSALNYNNCTGVIQAQT